MEKQDELDVAEIMPSMRKYLRTALSLKTALIDPGKLLSGQSRIGGEPDLPLGFQWPENENGPHSFIAQINLTEVAKHSQVLPLPPDGSLIFFYDSAQSAWGFDPNDVHSFKVVYVESSEHPLVRTALPENLDKSARFKASSLSMQRVLTLPPSDWGRFDPPLSKDERDWSMTFNDGQHPHYPYHWLGGHAHFVQNAMEAECQLVSNGIDCGGEVNDSERISELLLGADEWRPLLQITTDDDLEMMWGDCGILFFWIRESDLINRRFDKCWAILQCC